MASRAASTFPFVGAVFPVRTAAGMKGPMDRPSALPSESGGDAAELITLLAKIATGDRGAMRALYDRTSAKLYGICLRLLGDPAEAQDALQDAYLTVWRKAALFDSSKASAITWLAVLARNRAIDRQRRKPRPSDDLTSASEIPDDSASALELVEQAEDRSRLMRCLDELDERARTMIRAAFFDGATYSSLATLEGVPLPTVKSWIRRGLIRLRGCMER